MNVLYWKKNLRHCWDFSVPPWFGAPDIVPPLLRPWCDTSQQSALLWNQQNRECRTNSPNWEITTTLVRLCIQNAHVRLVRQILLVKSTGKRPKCRPRPRSSNCISDLAWSSLGVEPAELSEISVDCEVFQVLVLLPPRPSIGENRAWKWMKWITFTLFSLFTAVFKCLASQWTSSLDG